MTESSWADGLRTELVWLSTTLADEHAYAARLTRLMDALHRLSGPSSPEVPGPRAARGRSRWVRPGPAHCWSDS